MNSETLKTSSRQTSISRIGPQNPVRAKVRENMFLDLLQILSEKSRGQGSAPAGTGKGVVNSRFWRNGTTGNPLIFRLMPCSAQPETQDAGFCLKIRTSNVAHGSNANMAPSLKGYHARREVRIRSSPTRTPELHAPEAS